VTADSHVLKATRRTSVTGVLACCAVVLLAYETWTVVGWLADSPHQITAYRSHGSFAWYAARVAESLVLLSVVLFAVRSARELRQTRQVSVDLALVIGMATAAFWDPIYNWVTPAWLYSSDFLNINDWMGHAPGILNPDAGHMPWPVIIVLIGYPLWGVGFAALINRVMALAQRRRPSIGRWALGVVAFVTAGAITASSFAVFEACGLMDAPGYRLAFLGDSQLVFFAYSGGLVFGGLACLRWFRDRHGRALFEQDGHAGQRTRTVPTILAAIAACQILVIVGWGMLTVPFSLVSSPYPRTAGDLISGLCNAPGVHGTGYGPCPNAPGTSLRLR
jgi:Spirocyclase AveC-like